MATANRWAMSDGRIFAAVGLAVAGLFILSCGAGMSNAAVGGLGVAITVLGPGSIVLASMRSNVREYVYGEGVVHRAPPRPASGTTGRCDMDLLVRAARVDGVLVRVRDAEVDVRKWPQMGQRLPVLLPNGNPRRTKVLWEQVRPSVATVVGGEAYDRFGGPTSYGADLAVDELDERERRSGAPYVAEVVSPEEAALLGAEVVTPDEIEPLEPAEAAGPAEALEPLPVSPAAPATGRRRRPSPHPRRPADEVVVEEVTPAAEALPVAETALVAHAPVPGPVETVVVEPAETLEHTDAIIDEVGTGAPFPQHTGPAEPAGPVLPAGGAFMGPSGSESLPPMPTAEPIAAPEVGMGPEIGEGPVGPAESSAAYFAERPRADDDAEHGVYGVSVTLIVSDLHRSLEFYRDMVGLGEIDTGVASAVLASGDARIMLRQVADMPRVDRRVVHLNLEVDDVHAEYDRLKAAGVEFVHRPRIVSQGEHFEQWAATFRDPDGHAVTITRWEDRR